MTADLAAREKAAQLAEVHSRAFATLSDACPRVSDEEYARLENAEKDAAAAIEALGLHVMTDDDFEPFRCPMCNAQLLAEDAERSVTIILNPSEDDLK